MTEREVSAPNQKVRDREAALCERIDAVLADYDAETSPDQPVSYT